MAALFAVFFRAFWLATVVGGPDCVVGVPQLGAGVFGNKKSVSRMAALLAFRAYRATGGGCHISFFLRSSDGRTSPDLSDWEQVRARVGRQTVGQTLGFGQSGSPRWAGYRP